MTLPPFGSALCALTLTAALVTAPLAGPAVATHRDGLVLTDPQQAVTDGLYLVMLQAPPAAEYDGGRDGYPATRARTGRRFDAARPAVRRYRRLLTARQDAVLADIGTPPLVYRYTTALNGFAARLTGAQVKQLRAMPQVVAVEHNTVEHLATTDATDFLDLSGRQGVWAAHGGPGDAGGGVVVGVVDSGVWPENPSFADLPASTVEPGDLAGFTGRCESGEEWRRSDCGSKLVAARHFVRGFGADALSRSDYLSPRDGHGHGSHTAATIAGNHGVRAQIDGRPVGRTSGVAPAARLAVYKACWTAPDPLDDGCATADTVRAIDQAVADGVDVLNYSITGGGSLDGAVPQALRHAAASGVFVAAPAGNSGPDRGSVAHAAPWVTTVGASTYQQSQGAVVLGDGTWLVGAMASDRAVPESSLVRAQDVAAAGARPGEARRCFPGSLDARAAADTVVVCERGAVARLDKSTAVQRAGARGMVLVNTQPGSEDADLHAVPTVHLDQDAAQALERYLSSAGREATASLDPTANDGSGVPQVAPFSAAGPAEALGGGLLKPDLTAPGVGVVAAVAPPSNGGRTWDAFSGTSVAAPHVAGLAALLLTRHPRWSPAEVKSALMTTAGDLDGATRPVRVGAGQVEPTGMDDPGLVYDSGPKDWEALGPSRRDSSGHARPRDLNLPSIGVGSLVGRTTVRRTVTNVSRRAETYTASVSGLRGVDVAVRPGTMTLGPGEERTFRLRLTVDDQAEYGEYTQGWLTWRGSTGRSVRSPMAVRPQSVGAPRAVVGTGETGSLPLATRSGMTGSLDVVAHGMVGSAPQDLDLTPGAFDPADPGAGGDTHVETFGVPEGTAAVRFEARGARARDDLDLFVYRDGALVAASATPSAHERITLDSPEPGAYRAVTSAADAAGEDVVAEGTFTGWVVPERSADNLVVGPNPAPAVAGEPLDLTVSWSGLDPELRWFGVLAYDSSAERTYVSLD